MTKAELQRVLDWANEKLATGEEPPWAWYQYMKLRETLEAIMSGMDAVTPQKGSSLQSASQPERRLRLVESKYPQDSVRPHPNGKPVPLPM